MKEVTARSMDEAYVAADLRLKQAWEAFLAKFAASYGGINANQPRR